MRDSIAPCRAPKTPVETGLTASIQGPGIGGEDLSDCAVCSRWHHISRVPSALTNHLNHAEGRGESHSHSDSDKRQKNMDLEIYEKDCQVVLRKAVTVFSAVFGNDGRETARARNDYEALTRELANRGRWLNRVR